MRHGGEAPYRCNECEKPCYALSQLRYHRWMHTGHLPYKCELCKAGFREKGSLKYHMKRHAEGKIGENGG